jgi:hypothetical protein
VIRYFINQFGRCRQRKCRAALLRVPGKELSQCSIHLSGPLPAIALTKKTAIQLPLATGAARRVLPGRSLRWNSEIAAPIAA